MLNAKSILAARRDEIGRAAKIKAIHDWSKEFFSGVDDDAINNKGDISAGNSYVGWSFETDIRNSFLTVDCDTFENSKWQDTEVLRLMFDDIDAETIASVLAEHFVSVISNAKFIEI